MSGLRSLGDRSTARADTSGHERREGFVAAARRNGLRVIPQLVRECEWTIASGFEESMALLGGRIEEPTALVTASGELGLGSKAPTHAPVIVARLS